MENSISAAKEISATDISTDDWCVFVISDFFSISTGKERQGRHPAGTTPLIATGTSNNGLCEYVDIPGKSPFEGNTITVSNIDSKAVFYQMKSYFVTQNVFSLKPKWNFLSESSALFLLPVISKALANYGWGNYIGKSGVENLKVRLPFIATEKGNVPDWNFMCRFIDSIKKQVKVDRLQKINDNISSINKDVIDESRWVKFKLFKLNSDESGLFEVSSGKGPLIKDARANPGKIPLISSTESNNGVSAYVQGSAEHEENLLTLAVNGSVGECFFQATAFCATCDIKVLKPTFKINKNIALAMTAIIRSYGKRKYSYSRKWTKERMASDFIMLPATESGEPDLHFLDQYIEGLKTALFNQGSTQPDKS